jgi:outer membrane protein OmpA-like peptidoglycan-associated protein
LRIPRRIHRIVLARELISSVASRDACFCHVVDWGFAMQRAIIFGTVITGSLLFTIVVGGNPLRSTKRVDSSVTTPPPAEYPSRPQPRTSGPGDSPDVLRKPAPPDVSEPGVKYTFVLGEGTGGFSLNEVTLSDRTIAKIDELMATITDDLGCLRFVIEGYTDNLGSPEVNKRIGMARAIAVRQYLTEQFEIPHDAMRVVSYGADNPVGDNSTQEGRAQNRRVVIKIAQ